VAKAAPLDETRFDLYLAVCPAANDISFNEWMKMDLTYIDNWSLWLDFKIIFQTIKAVLRGEGR